MITAVKTIHIPITSHRSLCVCVRVRVVKTLSRFQAHSLARLPSVTLLYTTSLELTHLAWNILRSGLRGLG